MCRLSLAKIPQCYSNQTHLDSLSLDPIPCCLASLLRCPVLTAPVRSSTPTAFCCLPLWCPAANCPLLGRVVNCLVRVPRQLLSRVPFPLPDTARFHVQDSFVWFRAKTDSSALAAYPHSATYISLKKKTKTGYFRIINLFPSCFLVSGVNQKHEGTRIILYIYIYIYI